MSKIKDGGPAFPVAFDHATFQPRHVDDVKRLMSGMNMRDYFAAKAMQAQLTAFWAGETHHGWPHDEIAKEAYNIADAMLKAREQT